MTNSNDEPPQSEMPEHDDVRFRQELERFARLLDAGEIPDVEKFLETVLPRFREKLRADFVHELALRDLLFRENAYFAGKYQIVCKIGMGGMGTVYEAVELALNRPVALKVISLAAMPTLDAVATAAANRAIARFKREAEAVAKLHHDNIVPIYSVDEYGGIHYYAMQLLVPNRGCRNLQDTLNAAHGSRLKPYDAVRLLEPIARALQAAHEGEIIHRDVKPANMFWDGARLKLGDFGLAKLKSESDSATVRLTHSSQPVVGTLHYSPPEQIDEPYTVDSRTDVYALGVSMYQAITGQVPFHGAAVQIFYQILHNDPKSPRQIDERIPRDLENICLKCLRKDPNSRYQSGNDLANDLKRFLGGYPVLARPVGRLERVAKFYKRNWLAASLAVIVILIVSVMGPLLRLRGIDADKQRQVVAETLQVLDQVTERKHTELQRKNIAGAEQLFQNGTTSQMGTMLDPVPWPRRGFEWHLLNNRRNLGFEPQRNIGSHDWGTLVGISNAAGTLFVSSGLDGRVLAHDTTGSRSIELARGSWSQKYLLWRCAFFSLPGDEAPDPDLDCYFKLCWLQPETSVAAASYRGQGVVWDWKDAQPENAERRVVLDHDRPLFAVAASRDGQRLLFGDDRGLLVLVSNAGHERQTSNLLEGSPVLDILAISAEAWLVAQENGNLTVVSFDVSEVRNAISVPGPAWDVDLAPDGETVAVACTRDSVPTFRLHGNEPSLVEHAQYTLHNEPDRIAAAVHAVRFSADGRLLFAGDDRGKLMVWERGRTAPRGSYNLQLLKESAQYSKLPPPARRRVTTIEPAADSPAFFTGGHDPVVRQWDARLHRGKFDFNVGKGSILRFDPQDPALLWTVSANGRLALRDSLTGQSLSECQAHPDSCSALAVSRTRAKVVTYGNDQEFHFWQRVGTRIEPVRKSLSAPAALREIALSPDGTRLAGFDVDNYLWLWDVPTAKQLAKRSLADGGTASALTGALAFDASGSRLAVCGPHQSFFIFRGDSLTLESTPNLVQGAGGSVVVWDPLEPIVYAGDAQGRVNRHPTWPRSATDLPAYFPTEVSGIAVTPGRDPRRVATVCTSGEIHIVDPMWAGQIMTLKSDHASSVNPVAGEIHFDADGRKLALAHRDGHVEVWQAGIPQIDPPQATNARRWKRTDLLAGANVRAVATRAPAIALDDADRLVLVYSALRHDEEVVTNAPEGQPIFLGREKEGRLQSRLLADHGVERSLALALDRTHWHATVRRLLLDQQGSAGAFLLFQGPLAEGIDSETWKSSAEDLIGTPCNDGFDTSLGLDLTGQPVAVHFSHLGPYLKVTHRREGAWTTDRIGRQGDGLYVRAAIDPEGTVHAAFRPSGVAGFVPGICYLHGAATDVSNALRRNIDPLCSAMEKSLVVAADGTVSILVERRNASGHGQLAVVQLAGADSPPRDNVVLEWLPRTFGHLTASSDGRLFVAYMDDLNHQLRLATGINGQWTYETVSNLDSEEFSGDVDNFPFVVLVTLLDRAREPVIVAVRSSDERGSVAIFRPDR